MQRDHLEAVMEEGIKETKCFYRQGTELLDSSLTKRGEMSAVLCLSTNWSLLREKAATRSSSM